MNYIMLHQFLLMKIHSFLILLVTAKENSNQSILLNEEKHILDSKKEMLERKETILSGILNGKPHSLDVQ